jgi:hypothetical protein
MERSTRRMLGRQKSRPSKAAVLVNAIYALRSRRRPFAAVDRRGFLKGTAAAVSCHSRKMWNGALPSSAVTSAVTSAADIASINRSRTSHGPSRPARFLLLCEP